MHRNGFLPKLEPQIFGWPPAWSPTKNGVLFVLFKEKTGIWPGLACGGQPPARSIELVASKRETLLHLIFEK
jgi:hypothetical protein